jgi:hypothetical protein
LRGIPKPQRQQRSKSESVHHPSSAIMQEEDWRKPRKAWQARVAWDGKNLLKQWNLKRCNTRALLWRARPGHVKWCVRSHRFCTFPICGFIRQNSVHVFIVQHVGALGIMARIKW